MALPVDDAQLSGAVEAQAGSGDPLVRLVAALRVQEELDELSSDLVRRFVADARDAGCSWTRIGDALGVSKQAAQQRFARRAPAAGASAFDALLARATARARAAGRRQAAPHDVADALRPHGEAPTTLAAAALLRLGVGAATGPTAAAEPDAEPVRGTPASRTSRSPAVAALVARAGALAAARGATGPDSADLLVAVAEGEGLEGAEAGDVAEEVARLRRWGFTDG
jgi:hypothetical protein